MFAGQVVDPTEDRHMWIDFIFGGNVEETVVLNIEVRSAEIQFFARVDKLRFDRRPEFFAPEIRSGNVDFISRTARQPLSLGLGDIRIVGLFRFEISVTRT